MAKYKYLAYEGVNLAVLITEDESGNAITGKTISFPIDATGNTDYIAWKKWETEGNTTEAADGLTWDDIRATRDGILSSTDWTMTTGASVDQAQWAAYRQNIRDIPQTYSGKTPDEVVWPTQPSTAGPNS